ncbi:MAG TPA: MarR family winged helix-turn-helix transcriptional regulator [Pseudomonadales bacterium]|nr:MarR family winged helix-turn-helix transcriptional regulator [Pseudomonadales bacterium]
MNESIHTNADVSNSNKSGETQFKHNLGRDLSFLSRELSRSLMQKSVARGHKGLKLNWDTVFLNLDFRDGSRIVDLAQINGLTKQAMSQIVAEIEQQGYVAKKDDPSDGRARKIKLTAKGKKMVQDSMESYNELEAEYEALIGPEKLQTLKDIVSELVMARRPESL